MSIVTSLKPQKNQRRVNVYLDGKFAFGIDLDNLFKFGIKIDAQFSDEQIQKILHQAEFQKTLEKLVRFATTRPRSEMEVNLWFKKRKVAESLWEELKEKIKKYGFLDDETFARWWVEQRMTFRPKGIRALAMELTQKGVDRKIIEKVLEETPIDEVSEALKLLNKKSSKWERVPKEDKKNKMIQFLQRQGFSWDSIESAIEKYNIR